MSWPAIRAALATRIAAVTDVENVQQYLRYHKAGFSDATLRAQLFVDAGGGKENINCWQITRRSYSQEQAQACDDTVRRLHSVEIQGFLGFSDADTSEHVMNGLLDAICDDLNNGDRSLGGAALTHGLPQIPFIGTGDYMGLGCNIARITLTIEELV